MVYSYYLGKNHQVFCITTLYYQVFGVNEINYCQSSLLIENHLHGVEVSNISDHSHDIQVIARDLDFASVLSDNLDIMLIAGYNYNMFYIIYNVMSRNIYIFII